MEPVKRPLIVTAMCVVMFVLSLVFLVITEVILMSGPETVTAYGISVFAMGVAQIMGKGLSQLCLSYGMWEGWRGIWHAGILFAIADICIGLFNISYGVFFIVMIAVDIVFLILLFLPAVKGFLLADRKGISALDE